MGFLRRCVSVVAVVLAVSAGGCEEDDRSELYRRGGGGDAPPAQPTPDKPPKPGEGPGPRPQRTQVFSRRPPQAQQPGPPVQAAPAAGAPAPAQGAPPAGGGEDRLAAFIADQKPFLYRLVGDQAVPLGSVRFNNPVDLIADDQQRCFYVLDNPMRQIEDSRVWRIEPDGTGRIVAAHSGGRLTRLLAQDGQGRLIIGDWRNGLWRQQPDGQMQRLVETQGPLQVITAVAAGPGEQLLLACSYAREIREDPEVEGLIQDRRSQGGLYLVRPGPAPAAPEVRRLVENRQQGAPEHETHWRIARDLLVDSAGRMVLCDSGSQWRHEQPEYLGAQPPETPPPLRPRQRVLRADVDGGFLVYHPDGRLVDLTFATPDERRGLLRRPHAAAEWAPGTYLVADPGMYAPGMDGAGGLLLIDLAGRRGRSWRFGWRRQPVGVGILDAAAPPPPTPRRMRDLAGEYRGRAIETVWRAWRSGQEAAPGTPGPDAAQWKLAVRRAREVFEGARWRVSRAGVVEMAPPGGRWGEPGPASFAGRGSVEWSALLVEMQNLKRSDTDPALCHLSGALTPGPDGALHARLQVSMLADQAHTTVEFDQTLAPTGPAPTAEAAEPIAADRLAGRFVAGDPQIVSVSLRALRPRGQPGSPTYGLFTEWREVPAGESAERLRDLLAGSQWELTADGEIRWAARGAGLARPGPRAATGRVRHERHVAEFSAMNQFRSPTDSALTMLRGVIEVPGQAGLTLCATIKMTGDNERFDAEFILPLRPR